MVPLLLAPAGSFESLRSALDHGADAVYFGVGKLNMRSHATVNFAVSDLPEIVEMCHSLGRKAWLALNTLIYDSELDDVKTLCRAAKMAGVDAVIAVDPSVISYARAEGLPIHLSVQANVSNLESVRFHARYADVVVLARELTLEQIASICRAIREENITGPSGNLLEVEIFVHGALCVAVSGKCYMSLAAYNSSANRGACFQNCRRKYAVRDAETGMEFEVDNQYVMSPKDLCTIGFLDRILESGVSILKIEGRGRSADYVARATSVYREALDRLKRGERNTPELIADWETRLSEVFNRGFWKGGYYLGHPLGEWAASGDNRATVKKIFLGSVINYYVKAKMAEVHLSSDDLPLHARILITGNATGAAELTVDSLRVNERVCDLAPKGSDATFPSEIRLRLNDKVYLLQKTSETL